MTTGWKVSLVRKRSCVLVLVLILVLLLGSVAGTDCAAAGKNAIKKTLKVGKQMVLSHKDGAVFRSSNSSVACVNQAGRVTGKKKGTARITVRAGGNTTVYKVSVRKNQEGLSLPVALDEVEQVAPSINEAGRYVTRIRNNAKSGRIRKIEYLYSVNVPKPAPTPTPATLPLPESSAVESGTGEALSSPAPAEVRTETVILSAADISAGKQSEIVSCPGDASRDVGRMKLIKIKLYTGNALHIYDAATGKSSMTWGTADKKAPVISGWVGKKSICQEQPYRVCYSDRKNSCRFTDFVKAVDDRDGRVKLSVDTSRINWEKSGIYKVYYTAKDKSGNRATKWAKVRVIKTGSAEKAADSVLARITRKSWTDEKKARVIYRYVKAHMSYVNNAKHNEWRTAGLNALRYQSGDCYTHYALARLLLTRAGIYNTEIRRAPSAHAGRHWWNLVYIRDGWYHLDTTPRQRDGKFCLVTDAQLFGYSSGSTFRFDPALYPKRAAKKISPNP